MTGKYCTVGKTKGGEMNEQKQDTWLHDTVREITELAKLLGTDDMHLAGIIYLASIVRRRKRKSFKGVEINRTGKS